MYFEAKVCKVAVLECKPLNQSSTCWEGEGTIVYVKELIDFVGGESAGKVHAWDVAPHTACVKCIVW